MSVRKREVTEIEGLLLRRISEFTLIVSWLG
jgi:hypothetical protein